MKRILLVGVFLFTGLALSAQNNPYAVFGYKPKVTYQDNKQNVYRIKNSDPNDKARFIEFDFNKHLVNMLDKRDSIIQSIVITNDKLLRWISADPLAEKYPGSSPYNYVDGNPISRIDRDGRDWIVSTRTVNGKTQINLTYAAAVMNNSGKNINMNSFMAGQVKEFEKVFGQGNVHATMMLRQVSSAEDLKFHESLIDIQAGSNFRKSSEGTFVGGDAALGGKYVRLNADGIGKDGSLMDKKTAIHEIGHTGGLMHSFEFDKSQTFVNGQSAPNSPQSYFNDSNSPSLEANFMNYTGKAQDAHPFIPESYFRNTVGKATQDQIQTIINNLYNGNLNYDNIPKRK